MGQKSAIRRDGRRALAVYSAPWTLLDTPGATGCPARVDVPSDDDLAAQPMRCSLSGGQRTMLAAVHEAGHTVLYRDLGVPVWRVEVDGAGPRRSGTRANGTCGRTLRGDEEQPLPYWVAGHLAGAVAAEIWLQATGLSCPGNELFAHLQAAGDHAAIFALHASVPLVFYYGPYPKRMPEGFPGVQIDIDAMCSAARSILHGSWPAVEQLAAHLAAHGRAGPEVLRSLAASRLGREQIDDTLDAGMRAG